MKNSNYVYKEKLAFFKRYGYDISKERDFILSKAGLKNGSILEVGTGKGYMAVALARAGLAITSIDLDRQSQGVARNNLKAVKLAKRVNLRTMNAEKLRFKDTSFDYVIAVNFIHHAQNPAKCIEEMIRIARDRVVIADLNKRGELILEEVHAQEGRRHGRMKISFAKIKQIFKKAGMPVKTYRSRCQTVLVAEKG